MPAGNIEASACTRHTGSSWVNHRSPSAPQMRCALTGASSPATLLRSIRPSWRWTSRVPAVGLMLANLTAGQPLGETAVSNLCPTLVQRLEQAPHRARWGACDPVSAGLGRALVRARVGARTRRHRGGVAGAEPPPEGDG